MLSCQLCPIPRDPVDYDPPDSSVHFLGKNTGLCCNALPQGTSQTRDQTHVFRVSWIGRQILHHWATLEAPCYNWWVKINILLWLKVHSLH